jgi:hypothetical protein
MVKRLIDEQGLDSADSQLADLFRSAPPFAVDPFRKRRILVRLERGSSRSALRFWLKPTVFAGLLISGTAAAALGNRYVLHGSGFLGLGEAPNTSASTAAVAPKRAPLTKQAQSGAQLAGDPVPLMADSPEPLASALRPAGKSGSHARLDSSEDATHVVEAIQALRTEKDPARAQALLNDYLKSHPHGQLSGDALALSIEAASAQNDPRAADYARRYLATYPKGKYRDLAKRALEAAP